MIRMKFDLAGCMVHLFALGLLVALLSGLCALNAEAAGERRVALVIGNADYQGASNKLDNPVNDAELMAQTLAEVGFSVTKVLNANRFDMRKAMLIYSRSLSGANTIGLFYYAGHGMQVDGQNYLLPIDASPARKDELALHGVALSEFLQTLNSVSGSEGRLNVVILDACRNNPFARGWRSVGRGLATIDAPSGTLIAFATAPGDVAADGDGVNSPYTLALSEMIKQPGLQIEQTFKGTRNLVWKRTAKSGKAQIPWESTSLRGDFYFTPTAKGGKVAGVDAGALDLDKPGEAESGHMAKTAKEEPVTARVDAPVVQGEGDCLVIDSALAQPIVITKGFKICSADRKGRAVIKDVRKRAIVYAVNGSGNVVCSIKDVCQFNWKGAPLFKVNINAKKNSAGLYVGEISSAR